MDKMKKNEEKYDQTAVEINKRYQELFYSSSFQKKRRNEKYINYFKNGDFKKIIEDILFKIFIKIPSSTAGNVIKPNTSGELDITGKKIAVYSCIVGRYDSIVEPLYIDCDIDYFMFTDLDLPSDSKWKKIDITQFEEYNKLSPIQLNRKIKMLPHIYLKDYDYSIYVDGLIEIVCSMKPLIENMKSSSLGVHFHNQRDCIYDEAIMIKYAKKADMSIVNQQLNIYRNEGFPIHNGLYENTIMIRNHNSQLMCKLMDKWWDEYLKFPTRDQLSLPYLLWKNQVPPDEIYILGNNLNKNPRFNRGLNHL